MSAGTPCLKTSKKQIKISQSLWSADLSQDEGFSKESEIALVDNLEHIFTCSFLPRSSVCLTNKVFQCSLKTLPLQYCGPL